MCLREEGRPLEIVLHNDSPLTLEGSVEEFCLIRPWAEIREMFATTEPGSADLVLLLEHRESGAVFAELADVLDQVQGGTRPKLHVFLACDSWATYEDACAAWQLREGDEPTFTMFGAYDNRRKDYPLSEFVKEVVDMVLIHHPILEILPTLFERWAVTPADRNGKEASMEELVG
ncbi:MAG: hypothetical protein HYV34_03305 [Candidatus Kerfeldbacteria bacterium]|nr:hypothetical protein [Candidatus Kerfeldbacteria bacterium]